MVPGGGPFLSFIQAARVSRQLIGRFLAFNMQGDRAAIV